MASFSELLTFRESGGVECVSDDENYDSEGSDELNDFYPQSTIFRPKSFRHSHLHIVSSGGTQDKTHSNRDKVFFVTTLLFI